MKIFNTRLWIYVAAVVLIAAALCIFTSRFEVMKPDIRPAGSIERIGLHKTVLIDFSDNKSGLRHINVSIAQGDRNYTLSSLDVPDRGKRHLAVSVEIDPPNLKFHDGEATLTITASDYSLFRNTARLAQKVAIDMSPPRISILSSYHNIFPGGSCLAIYQISKDVDTSGIQSGSNIFPGYPISLNGKGVYISYFPIPLSLDNNLLKFSVYAKDKAGNDSIVSIPYHAKARKFRKDSVDISEAFLSTKMPEFQQRDPNLRGKTFLETFVYVNQTMREENFKTIQSICSKTSGTRLWQGPFLRMKNAAPMALFGDMRTYTFQKQKIGESVHLGVDLASTAHAVIEAANSGTVVFAGYLGIYGNAVIIDHGLGIFSLYAHMSDLKAKEGQQVAKGDVIGLSGSTGLAGGDHLHFSMLVGGRFVNPLEWWDPHWIADNVDKKLSEASQHL